MQMCVFATLKGKGMTICDHNRQQLFKKLGKGYPTHFIQHRISKTMIVMYVIRCNLHQNMALYKALKIQIIHLHVYQHVYQALTLTFVSRSNYHWGYKTLQRIIFFRRPL